MSKLILTKRSFLAGLETNVEAVGNNDIPNLLQVQAITDGRQNVKDSVRLLSDTNISLNALQGIDGIQTEEGNRILVAGQTDKKQNGIYIASSGTWERSLDADVNGELKPYTSVFTREGGVHASQKYVLQSTTAIDITVSEQVWVHESSVSGTADHIGVSKTDITWVGENVQEVLESAEDAVEGNAANITTNTGAISDIDTRVGTAESEIDTLQTELDAAEATIVTNTQASTDNATDIDDLETFTGSGGAATPTYANDRYVTDADTLVAAIDKLDAEIYKNRVVTLDATLAQNSPENVEHNLGNAYPSTIAVYNATGELITNDVTITVVDANTVSVMQNGLTTMTVKVVCRY